MIFHLKWNASSIFLKLLFVVNGLANNAKKKPNKVRIGLKVERKRNVSLSLPNTACLNLLQKKLFLHVFLSLFWYKGTCFLSVYKIALSSICSRSICQAWSNWAKNNDSTCLFLHMQIIARVIHFKRLIQTFGCSFLNITRFSTCPGGNFTLFELRIFCQ